MGEKENQVSGKSIIEDHAAERNRVALATFAGLTGASSYIIMVFIAMPLSVHLIVNLGEDCPENRIEEEQCFAPTDKSQRTFTWILTTLRICTLVFGSIIGAVSDRYGRKPILILALIGYSLTGACFLIGWEAQSKIMFYVGAGILGACSPINPQVYAYVTDISAPNRLARNMGYVQGFGYFFGLMLGAVVSLIITGLTTGSEGAEDENLTPYNKLFVASYSTGLVFSAITAIVMTLFLPESLHADDRMDKIDWTRANPFGFIVTVVQTPYLLLVWLSAFAGWVGVGATEAVLGGWWLRRFAITDINVFVVFIIVTWLASAVGSVIMTPLYTKCLGVKKAMHLTMFFTCFVAISVAFAQNYKQTYANAPVSFISVSVYPLTLTVLMGQVNEYQRGALAGALRSSEALAKIIGITTFGNMLANTIEPFTPDRDCIPATYSSSNQSNTCDCGVVTCPFAGTIYLPEECSNGELTAVAYGKPGKHVPALTPLPFHIYPDVLVTSGQISRPDTCLGSGLVENTEGFVSEQYRKWCLSETTVLATLPEELENKREAAKAYNSDMGCKGFDFITFTREMNMFWHINNITTPCKVTAPPPAPVTDPRFVSTGCIVPNVTAFYPVTTTNYPITAVTYPDFPGTDPSVINGPFEQEFLDSYTKEMMESAKIMIEFFVKEASATEIEETEDGLCASQGDGFFNVCLYGVIADFPGKVIVAYGVSMALVSWFFFIIAEIFFVGHDRRGWVQEEEEGGGEYSDEAGDGEGIHATAKETAKVEAKTSSESLSKI